MNGDYLAVAGRIRYEMKELSLVVDLPGTVRQVEAALLDFADLLEQIGGD